MSSSRIHGIEFLSTQNKERWLQRGRSELEMLAIPPVLKDEISRSLDVPQYGPYHNEGFFMAAHLGLMVEVIDQISEGSFDFGKAGFTPEQEIDARRMITKAIQSNRNMMKEYAYHHDIKKKDCMNIEYAATGEDEKKRQEIFTMDEWDAFVHECERDYDRVRALFEQRGITKIGYRQSEELTGTAAKDHGEVAGHSLRSLMERDETVAAYFKDKELLLVGVENHEIHFQVFRKAKNALQYEEQILSRFSDDEISFIFAACFIDIAASLGNDGLSDYQGFRNMLEARQCHERIMAYQQERDTREISLRIDEVLELKKLHGLNTVNDRIAKKESELIKSKPIPLTESQINRIKEQLTDDVLTRFSMDANQRGVIVEALHAPHYAQELQKLGLGKMIVFIKSYIQGGDSL